MVVSRHFLLHDRHFNLLQLHFLNCLQIVANQIYALNNRPLVQELFHFSTHIFRISTHFSQLCVTFDATNIPDICDDQPTIMFGSPNSIRIDVSYDYMILVQFLDDISQSIEVCNRFDILFKINSIAITNNEIVTEQFYYSRTAPQLGQGQLSNKISTEMLKFLYFLYFYFDWHVLAFKEYVNLLLLDLCFDEWVMYVKVEVADCCLKDSRIALLRIEVDENDISCSDDFGGWERIRRNIWHNYTFLSLKIEKLVAVWLLFQKIVVQEHIVQQF